MSWPRIFGAVNYKLILSVMTGIISLLSTHAVMSAPAQDPLFLAQPVRPIMMLNMSRDHQLFFKLYDDYSDITSPTGGERDGRADTTYVHAYDYYGYFDSKKCYVYNTTDNRFNPTRFANAQNYCNYAGNTNTGSEWSGNFLNWASMTRIDAVRKILYGGMRSSDTADLTVLERAFLPQDAHSFAKYYNGTDIDKLTPFDSSDSVTMGADNENSGITICNTTEPANRNNLSQSDTGLPLMRVARGNYSLWASNERWQCRWGTAKNDNNASLSGIKAHTTSPENSGNNNRRLGGQDFTVRVRVCMDGLIGDANNENCSTYNGKWKPIGLLQEYGETGLIQFGLMTGSYVKNKSGGVLRKKIGSMADEINADGTFVRPTTGNANSFNGIIRTLDLLRIYGYRFSDGTYHNNGHGYDSGGSDGCLWSRSSFGNGYCTNWGNPQSEIFLESLRYLSGQSPSNAFSANDSARISGLNTASWTPAPISNDNYCAPLSIIQFNASTSSYDGDELDASGIGMASVSTATNAVGAAEGINNQSFFIGSNGTNNNQLCTAKTVENLADASGTCPDAPRLEGSYQIAGLAHYARASGIPLAGVTRGAGKQTVRTYGVALAPAVPRVTVKVPGTGGASGTPEKTITILPACRNTNSTLATPANCALVDFKIVDQQFDVVRNGVISNTGKLYVNWEDSEQGGDFDQDMWGVINYVITNNKVTVTTQVIAQSTGDPMGFGYVISGTTDDGFHVHSGVNDFRYENSCTANTGSRCTCRTSGTEGACNSTHAGARSQEYTIGTSTAKLLEQPLYYAAKWGGYLDDAATNQQIAAADPETYFFATDPRQLEASLRNAFASVADSIGSASAVATNSTRLSEGSFLYQARFNSRDWSGELLAYQFDDQGGVEDQSISTNSTLHSGSINSATRTVYTYDGSEMVSFEWAELNDAQKSYLRDGDSEAIGQARVSWIRGAVVEGLREREKVGANQLLLGDIVNSSPVYLGGTDMRYDRLPGTAGSSYRTYLQTKRDRAPHVFVGANDGMLHAFNAETLEETFAYIPAGVYPKLAAITKTGYGRGGSGNPHQYLVDGPITIGDAYIDNEWRSVLVGTLGAGGKGVFALDVTDPTSPEVLFELNDVADLGFVGGTPFIVPLKNGNGIRWAVVFGNGYEAGSSSLFWVDLETRVVNKITASATGAGLSAPELLPNSSGVIVAAYAGDLNGYMWKFDLSNSSAAEWSAVALFRAMTPGENPQPQPITAPPTLGLNAKKNNAVMVYFGTGQYVYQSDNNANIPVQSFYAIVDKGVEIGGRDDLHEKTILTGNGTRTIGNNEVEWSTVDGWYMDFPTSGERLTTRPLLLYDKLIFASLIPSAIPCEFGGSSWIMEVPAVGDKYVNYSILDGNTYNNFLILGDLGFGVLNDRSGDGGEGNGGEGDGEENGAAQCPAGQYPAKVIFVSSSGELGSEDGCISGEMLGRMSWRQLR